MSRLDGVGRWIYGAITRGRVWWSGASAVAGQRPSLVPSGPERDARPARPRRAPRARGGVIVRPAYLVIVRRGDALLLSVTGRRFAGDPAVEVIVDRRQAVHGVPVERRRGTDFWEDLRYHPVVIVRKDARDRTRPEHREEFMTTFGDDARLIEEWMGQGQELAQRVMPGLRAEFERLAAALDAAERECRKLRDENDALREDNGRLRADAERMRYVQTEVAQTFSSVVAGMQQVMQPLQDLAHRLGPGR